ncbi:MAG TPA: DMT family transporter [Aggregatilineales bacterium]|jgi:drug/metabolite transporter (DMT)-like permease|nr:DMT family transporter [Aggregatilineales bacterium]
MTAHHASRAAIPAPARLHWLIVLSPILLWASAFVAIRIGLRGYEPQTLALLRYLVASGLLGIYALVTRMPLPRLRDWPGLAALGFTGFTVYTIALNAGEVGVSAGIASFVISLETVTTALLAAFFLGERLTRPAWIGIALSIVGVAVISLISETGAFYFDWRILLLLLAQFAISIYTVWQGPYVRRYGSLRFVAYAMWAGTFFMLPFLPELVATLPTAPAESTLAAIYMGIFPAIIAYAGWSYTVTHMPVSVAGSLLTLIPICTLVIAWLVLGEQPGLFALVGGVLILGGVLLITRYERPR